MRSIEALSELRVRMSEGRAPSRGLRLCGWLGRAVDAAGDAISVAMVVLTGGALFGLVFFGEWIEAIGRELLR